MMYRSIAEIQETVPQCDRCPRLRAHCAEVAEVRKRQYRDEEYWGRPVPSFGDLAARLLIVGLAPAAHGANRTGRMFTGDSSGNWLYEALHRFEFANQAISSNRNDGLTLHDCYITAVARCAPPRNKPTREELENCRPYLTAECELLERLELVLVLGRIAHEHWLRASGWWDRLAKKERPEFFHAAEHVLPDGKTLVCSYHPSRQNTNTGRLTRRMWYQIFKRCRALLDG